MKMKEAIDIICSEYTSCENKALKDAYRKAINALEREKPIEPRRTEWRGLFNHPYYGCPICGRFVPYCEQGVTYCSCCGQALLWE